MKINEYNSNQDGNAHGHYHGIVHDDMTLLGTNKGVTIILINNSRKNEDFILKRLFSFFYCHICELLVWQLPKIILQIVPFQFSPKVGRMGFQLTNFHDFQSDTAIFH